MTFSAWRSDGSDATSVETLRARLEQALDALGILTRQRAELIERTSFLEDLAGEMQAALEHRGALEQENAQLTGTLHAAEQRARGLSERVGALQEQLAGRSRQIERLKSGEVPTDAVQRAEAELADERLAAAAAEEMNADLTAQLARAREEIEQLEFQLLAAWEAHDALDRQHGEIKSAAVAEVAAAEQLIEETDRQAEALRSELDRRDAEVAALQRTVATAEAEARAATSDMTARVAAAVAARDAALTAAGVANQRADRVETERRRVEQALKSEQRRSARLEGRLTAANGAGSDPEPVTATESSSEEPAEAAVDPALIEEVERLRAWRAWVEGAISGLRPFAAGLGELVLAVDGAPAGRPLAAIVEDDDTSIIDAPPGGGAGGRVAREYSGEYDAGPINTERGAPALVSAPIDTVQTSAVVDNGSTASAAVAAVAPVEGPPTAAPPTAITRARYPVVPHDPTELLVRFTSQLLVPPSHFIATDVAAELKKRFKAADLPASPMLVTAEVLRRMSPTQRADRNRAFVMAIATARARSIGAWLPNPIVSAVAATAESTGDPALLDDHWRWELLSFVVEEPSDHGRWGVLHLRLNNLADHVGSRFPTDLYLADAPSRAFAWSPLASLDRAAGGCPDACVGSLAHVRMSAGATVVGHLRFPLAADETPRHWGMPLDGVLQLRPLVPAETVSG